MILTKAYKVKFLLFWVLFYVNLNAHGSINQSQFNKMLDTAHTNQSKAHVYFYSAQHDFKTEENLLKALNIYTTLNDKKEIENTLQNILEYYRKTQQLEKSAIYLNKIINIHEETNDELNQAIGLRILGETYRAMGFYNKALDKLYYSLYLMNKLQNSPGIYRAQNRIAAVHFEFVDTKPILIDSIRYYANQSINLSKQFNDEDNLINSYNILAGYYIRVKKLDSALIYLNIMKEFFEKNYLSTTDVSNLLIKMAKISIELKDYNKGLEYAHEALIIALNCEFLPDIELASNQIYVCYYSQNNLLLAHKYLLMNYYFYRKQNNAILKSKVLEMQKIVDVDKYKIEVHEQKSKNIELLYTILVIALIFIFIIITLILRNKITKANKKALLLKNEQIIAQNNELTELNITKDKFFSIIAHDLRNPIGSFINYTTMMQTNFDNFSEEDKHEIINDLVNSSKSIYMLLENLLTWSRSQRGLIQNNPENCNFNLIIDTVLIVLNKSIEEKSIKLITSFDPEDRIYADVNLLNAVLRNLITNAIKFTNLNGTIKLITKSSGNEFQVDIIDNGIGIPAVKISELFKVESKFHRPGTNGEPSSGLGLVICKEFIEKIGGTINIESKEGLGSKFTFTVPKFQPE